MTRYFLGALCLVCLFLGGWTQKQNAEVTVINPIQVPPGREAEALEIWDRYAEVFRQQPGYLGTQLHRSVDPKAKFALVNVAKWQSAEHFLKALNSDAIRSLGQGFPEDMPHFPSIYRVIRN